MFVRGFLNFFLSERKTLFMVFFSGEGRELLILLGIELSTFHHFF